MARRSLVAECKTSQRLHVDYDVVGLDVAPGPQTTHIGDIRDRKVVEALLDDVGAVVHVAALLTPHVGVRSDSEFHDINVTGTSILLECALRARVPRFVFTSTTSVYGCSTRPHDDAAIWVTEELLPHAEGIYDTTKLDAERLCQKAADQGLACIVLRMSRCFPEPENLVAFYRMYRGVDRRDMAEGHWLAVHAPVDGFEIVNISAKSPFARTDCTALWTRPWDVIDRHFPTARPEFSVRRWPLPKRIDRVYVTQKAEERLGFRSRFNFDSLLREGIQSG
jgi:nucleoside-diphosphate-sugar epimerase